VKLALDVSAVPARPAGAGRYIVEIARRASNDDTSVSLVARRGDGERWRTLAPAARVLPNVPTPRAARLAYERFVLGRTSVSRASDVWHSPHYTMPHGRSGPVVVTVHDTTYFSNPEWHERSKVAYFTRAIRYAMREAGAVIAVSDTTARELAIVAPGPAPVVVAPHGVDLTHFTTDGSRDTVPTVPYIFFLGTREPRKGLDVLLAAFDVLAATDNEVELWIGGQIGWGADSVERQSASSFAHRVRALGYVKDEDLPRLLRGARAVAYPSRGEGFGLPVLEAMACGAPVITTAGTSMAEVGGDTVSLIPSGDVEALASALSDALALDDTARADVSRRARDRALTFTWERSMAAHRHAYEIAAERHARNELTDRP
jgi:glycosyltransferase involved in cell wall biosynthesis